MLCSARPFERCVLPLPTLSWHTDWPTTLTTLGDFENGLGGPCCLWQEPALAHDKPVYVQGAPPRQPALAIKECCLASIVTCCQVQAELLDLLLAVLP